MKMQISVADSATEGDWNALIAEWLASLYLAPLALETVRSFRDGPGEAFLDALALQPECSVAANRMRAILRAGDDPAEVTRRLSTEFCLLFDGAGGPRTASPYESAYLGSSGRLFQKPTRDIDALLRQADLSVPGAVSEPADHLSIELALLARMMRHGGRDRDQAALLDVHLMNFAPIFAVRCSEVDRTGFYAAAADLMIGFLLARRQALRGASAASRPSIEKSRFPGARRAGPYVGEALS